MLMCLARDKWSAPDCELWVGNYNLTFFENEDQNLKKNYIQTQFPNKIHIHKWIFRWLSISRTYLVEQVGRILCYRGYHRIPHFMPPCFHLLLKPTLFDFVKLSGSTDQVPVTAESLLLLYQRVLGNLELLTILRHVSLDKPACLIIRLWKP